MLGLTLHGGGQGFDSPRLHSRDAVCPELKATYGCTAPREPLVAMVTCVLRAPIESLLCAQSGRSMQWAELGGPQPEVSYQPSVRVSRLSESQQNLPQVNAGHELHEFV
jgi:hypothetical protein